MATMKVKWLVLSIFFAIICVNINGDAGVEIASLITSLSIVRLEKVVDEKAGSISSLQGEIDLIQKKGSVAIEEQVGKAHARTIELEKQCGMNLLETRDFEIRRGVEDSEFVWCYIVIALLQLAPETYDLFDDIILLSDGQIVYQGIRRHILVVPCWPQARARTQHPFDKRKSHLATSTTFKYGVSKKELLKACFSREWLLMKRNSFVYIFKMMQ
ncbi:hypothetical protein IFM89_006367, partial [Coptis chinensis]